MLVYLDSNIVIYLVEDPPGFGARAAMSLAELRAHLAAAVEARCDRFLTNDHRLAKFSGLTIEVLP